MGSASDLGRCEHSILGRIEDGVNTIKEDVRKRFHMLFPFLGCEVFRHTLFGGVTKKNTVAWCSSGAGLELPP
jgi:hypothetical protein